MATSKGHAQIKQHLTRAQAAHKQTGESLNQIAQILSAMKGVQDEAPQQQPAAPPPGVSPLGGQAQ